MVGAERDKLIEENLDLVWWVMSKYYPTTLNSPEREDFYQIGCVGLIFAAKNYEPGPVQFSTFAVRIIQSRIRNELITRYTQKRTAADEIPLDAPIRAIEDSEKTVVGTITDNRWSPDYAFYDLDKFRETLTTQQKRIFNYMLAGLNQREIAERIGCSRQNVNQKTDRVRTLFAKFYDIQNEYNKPTVHRKRGRPRKNT